MNWVQEKRQKSVGEKLLLAGGSATLALASGTSGEAAVVSALNTPISPPSSLGARVWDVDGDSNGDFKLEHDFSYGFIFGDLTEIDGGRFVALSSGNAFAKLASGFVVGASMSGFAFSPNARVNISVTVQGTIASDAGVGGWSIGDVGFFGFKFTSGGNTYYGWGEFDLPGGTPGSGFTITKAYYETTPGASITVGDTVGAIPEPSTCALALLAAGGVAAYRSRRKQAAV
jgi:hypothetical protein